MTDHSDQDRAFLFDTEFAKRYGLEVRTLRPILDQHKIAYRVGKGRRKILVSDVDRLLGILKEESAKDYVDYALPSLKGVSFRPTTDQQIERARKRLRERLGPEKKGGRSKKAKR